MHEYWPDHSSRIHMVSLDIYHMTLFLEGSQWSNAADYVLDGVHQLMKTDIDFLLIASNTGDYTREIYLSETTLLGFLVLLYRSYRSAKNTGMLSEYCSTSY